jgi:hypothetical protein
MSERDPNGEPFDFDYGGDLEARVAEFLRVRNVGGTIIVSFEEYLKFSELVAAGYYDPWQCAPRDQRRADPAGGPPARTR